MKRLSAISRLTSTTVLSLLLLAGPVRAHTLSVAHLDIVVPDNGSSLTLELDLALRDVALTLPLDANHDELVTWGELTAVRAQLDAMVAAGLGISSEAGRCTLSRSGLATRKYDDGTYATLRLTAQCPSTRKLRVRYALFFDRDPQHRALVTVHRGNEVTAGIARADAMQVDIPLHSNNPFLDFLREGVHHILVGYDHLLFLASLLLPAALLRLRRQWQPANGFRACFNHVLGIVTAFTLAHSVTLSLAAMGWVTPASRWVEAGIALSVMLAALNNVWPVLTRRVWMVAFGFGLVHGFGFAGALSEIGLPNGARLFALVGFNLGVEVGQLAVVAALLPVLYALRLKPWYPGAVMRPASLLIAAIASLWLFRRLTG